MSEIVKELREIEALTCLTTRHRMALEYTIDHLQRRSPAFPDEHENDLWRERYAAGDTIDTEALADDLQS
jgi:hypothetical protein